MGVLAPGDVLGGCRIEAVIGRGGMGIVYRARQLELDRDVAVKVIAPELVEDPQIRKRFLSEAHAAGAIEHPNVVPVHSAGIEEDRAYLVMRYIDGHDLRTVVMAEGPLSPDRATRIAEQLGEALDAIHHHGYVHRDLKPQNVMIDAAGHVYLSDFGLAKRALATAGETRSEQWVGTLDYVAPEQIRGERVDARADVYSFGGVLYFMLTKRVPFERANDHAKLWAQLADPPPRPSDARPELAPELDAVVLRALAKDPAERFPSAGDLARSARSAAGHGGAPAPERTVARGAAAPEGTTLASASSVALRRRRRRAPVLAAGALVLVAGVVALLLLRDDDGAAGTARPTPEPTATAEPTPEPPRVVATVEDVAFRPRGVVIARGDAWVTSTHQGRIARLDTETLKPHGRQQWIGQGATGIARDGKMIWIAHRRRSALMGISARTGRSLRFTATQVPPLRVAAGRSGVWLAVKTELEGPAEILRYDRAGRDLVYRRSFPQGIAAITLGGGYLWIALEQQARIVRISRDSEVEHGAWLNAPASELSYGAGHLWASVPDDDSVEKIDPDAKNTVDSALVRRPEQVVVAHGRVWAASGTTHSVAVINPRTTRRVDRVKVPPHPHGMTSGAGGIWVTSIGPGSLTRIDP